MRPLTMAEGLRFVQACELAPDLIATNGVDGEVHFEVQADLELADIKTYIEAFAEGVSIAPSSIKLTRTRTAANEPCGLVIITTEN